MEWLKTDGGALIVIPEVIASAWHGSDLYIDIEQIERTGQDDDGLPDCDYNRTYSVDGWIATIPVGDGDALVVSTEHSATAIWQEHNETCIIEWFYADSDEQLMAHFRQTLLRGEFETSAVFRHPGGRLILMSAADVISDPVYDVIYFELPVGEYQMRTIYVDDDTVSYVAHRFGEAKS